VRLQNVREVKASKQDQLEPLIKGGDTAFSMNNFSLGISRSLKRRVMDAIATRVLKSMSDGNRKKLGFNLAIPSQVVAIGERWVSADSWNRFWESRRGDDVDSVLIQGCSVGDIATQKWLCKNVPWYSVSNCKTCRTFGKKRFPLLNRSMQRRLISDMLL